MADDGALGVGADRMPAVDRYRWVLLGGIWLVYFCFGLVGASMAPLIPAIGSELGISNATMGAILGAWPLVYIGSAIPCGVLLDRLTPRSSLLLGSAVIALSALLRGVAEDSLTLFLAVGLFGIGGPLISVGAPKFSAQWFSGKSRGIAIGIYTTGPALGAAAALSLTASVLMPLFDQDWRSVMVAYAAIALSGGAIWFLIAGHPLARPPADFRSAQSRFRMRSVLDILRVPGVQVVLAMALGVFFVNHAMNNWLPEILRAKGLTAGEAGYWASVTMIVSIAGSLVVPRYAVPHRRLAILALVFLAMMVSGVLLMLPPGPTLAVPLVLIGIARTSATAIVMLVLIELPQVGSERHGLVGGMFFVAGEIGGFLGPLTVGVLSQKSAGFESSLWVIAATSTGLAMLVVLFAITGKRGNKAPR